VNRDGSFLGGFRAGFSRKTSVGCVYFAQVTQPWGLLPRGPLSSLLAVLHISIYRKLAPGMPLSEDH